MGQQGNIPASQKTTNDPSTSLPDKKGTLTPGEKLAMTPSETLREVLEHAQDASYKRNLVNNSYDYLSPAFTRMTGHRVEDFLNLSLAATLDLIHPEDLPGLERGLANALQDTSSDAHQVDYRFRHRDGHYLWLQDKFTVLRNSEQQPIALIGSVCDTTQTRTLSDDVQKYRSNLDALFESTADLIWSVGLDHRLVIFNDALKAWTVLSSRSSVPVQSCRPFAGG